MEGKQLNTDQTVQMRILELENTIEQLRLEIAELRWKEEALRESEKRFRNIAHLGNYCQALENGESPIDFEEKLNGEAKTRELLAIQLRMKEGIDLSSFQRRHGEIPERVIRNIEKLQKQGLLMVSSDRIALSRKGVFYYDTVAEGIV